MMLGAFFLQSKTNNSRTQENVFLTKDPQRKLLSKCLRGTVRLQLFGPIRVLLHRSDFLVLQSADHQGRVYE